MRSKCETPLGHMKHNIPDSKALQRNGPCATCGHSYLSHLASCFARGCKCKEYVSISK